MRITARKALTDFSEAHPDAGAALERWYQVTKAARWTSFQDVRRSLARADVATVRSGRTVVILNIAGGSYRLITAVHYASGRVFTLMVLTHGEYGEDRRKDRL
jgi:mRNA interferase HigB